MRVRVVVETSNLQISRHRLAGYVMKSHQKACRTCSKIIFSHSTNQIIDLLRCRCCCPRRFLNPRMTTAAVATLSFALFGTWKNSNRSESKMSISCLKVNWVKWIRNLERKITFNKRQVRTSSTGFSLFMSLFVNEMPTYRARRSCRNDCFSSCSLNMHVLTFVAISGFLKRELRWLMQRKHHLKIELCCESMSFHLNGTKGFLVN